MQVRNRMKMVVLISALVPALISGCGHGEDVYGMIQPDLQAMQSRLQSHYDTVTGILSAGGVSAQGTGAFAVASSDAQALPWPDRRAIRDETSNYGQQMSDLMGSVGETVTTLAGCSMMMGGTMMGPQGTQTCPCAPYVGASEDVLQEHLALMQELMTQQDVPGMWEAMKQHLGQMGNSISQMGASMQQMHTGRSGGMMGMH